MPISEAPMGTGWADIYTNKVLNSKSAMKKILLQLALLLVTFAANAELINRMEKYCEYKLRD